MKKKKLGREFKMLHKLFSSRERSNKYKYFLVEYISWDFLAKLNAKYVYQRIILSSTKRILGAFIMPCLILPALLIILQYKKWFSKVLTI